MGTKNLGTNMEEKMRIHYQRQLGRKLIKYGLILLLLGLLTGFAIPAIKNPRMGLSSHLEGTMNGMLLIIFGIVWPKLHLSMRTLKWAYGLALFGTFTNWFTTLLAGVWGAGADHLGLAWQEGIIKFGLLSLSMAMIIVAGILIWGMRGNVIKR